MHDNCGGCGWTCTATGGFLPWWVRLLLVAGAAAGMTKLAVLVGKGPMVASAAVASVVVIGVVVMAVRGSLASGRNAALICDSWTAMDLEDQAVSVPLEEYAGPDESDDLGELAEVTYLSRTVIDKVRRAVAADVEVA